MPSLILNTKLEKHDCHMMKVNIVVYRFMRECLCNTDGLKFLKNNATRGMHYFVKLQYPEVFNYFKDF